MESEWRFEKHNNVAQRRLRWFTHNRERMTVDQIPHNAPHARLEVMWNKGWPRLHWMDNIHVDEDIVSFRLTLSEKRTRQMTEDSGDHLFVLIAAKLLASATDDDEYMIQCYPSWGPRTRCPGTAIAQLWWQHRVISSNLVFNFLWSRVFGFFYFPLAQSLREVLSLVLDLEGHLL